MERIHIPSGTFDISSRSHMQQKEFIETTNKLAAAHVPFLFMVDFEMEKPFVCALSQAKRYGITFFANGNTNAGPRADTKRPDYMVTIDPVEKPRYSKAFHHVKRNILKGNSYLLNLTFPSGIRTNLRLNDVFYYADAPYKLLHKHFVVFSPECFIKITGDEIHSFPMKGTIDAGLPNARETILQNKKELWEHNTIVDLIRNDLSMVSDNVRVTRFRYITKIRTHKNELLQVSSEVSGKLPPDWKNNFGNLLLKMLPAGSVSGAPKRKTLEIIREAEGGKRGYYTGVFGIFDGENVDSAVMIRFIEQTDGRLHYRSGGGITAMSDEQEEYHELIDKIYVPFV